MNMSVLIYLAVGLGVALLGYFWPDEKTDNPEK